MNDNFLVIIVTYNGMKWIDKCIRSVLSSTIQSDIYVVDNASTDETPDYIKQNFPTVHLTCSNKNLGFGAANNIGLQYALDNNYDYVYLLNQDAWVKEDTFEKMIFAHKQHPEYGILSPIQLEGNEKHFDKDFGEGLSKWREHAKVCEDLFFRRNLDIVPFPMIMAAHWLISRKCLEDVGGFSPAFFHYGEDNNYAERVWEKGYKLGVVMSALAIHDRENRVYSKEKICYLDFCRRIHDISGFKKSAKNVLWDYTYEMLLNILFHRKNIICKLGLYKTFLFNIPRYKKLRLASTKKCAFLKEAHHCNN